LNCRGSESKTEKTRSSGYDHDTNRTGMSSICRGGFSDAAAMAGTLLAMIKRNKKTAATISWARRRYFRSACSGKRGG
jgi:hypothetical protein